MKPIVEKQIFEVKKQTLLLIAGIVWLIAGFNVARLDILSYRMIGRHWYISLLSLLIFLLFGKMFFSMTEKHCKRIFAYEEYRPFWHFFDGKSYLIMAIMMGGGVGLRASGILPEFFIAFFYTGLGLALAFARVIFLRRYIENR